MTVNLKALIRCPFPLLLLTLLTYLPLTCCSTAPPPLPSFPLTAYHLTHPHHRHNAPPPDTQSLALNQAPSFFPPIYDTLSTSHMERGHLGVNEVLTIPYQYDARLNYLLIYVNLTAPANMSVTWTNRNNTIRNAAQQASYLVYMVAYNDSYVYCGMSRQSCGMEVRLGNGGNETVHYQLTFAPIFQMNYYFIEIGQMVPNSWNLFALNVAEQDLSVLVQLTPGDGQENVNQELYLFSDTAPIVPFFPRAGDAHTFNAQYNVLIVRPGIFIIGIYCTPDSAAGKYRLLLTAGFSQESTFSISLFSIVGVLTAVIMCGFCAAAIVARRRRLNERRRYVEAVASATINLHMIREARNIQVAQQQQRAEPHEIEALPTHSYVTGSLSDEDAKCTICLGEYEASELIKTLHCQHHFHAKCIDSWLQNKRNCPLCLQDISHAQNRKQSSPDGSTPQPAAINSPNTNTTQPHTSNVSVSGGGEMEMALRLSPGASMDMPHQHQHADHSSHGYDAHERQPLHPYQINAITIQPTPYDQSPHMPSTATSPSPASHSTLNSRPSTNVSPFVPVVLPTAAPNPFSRTPLQPSPNASYSQRSGNRQWDSTTPEHKEQV